MEFRILGSVEVDNSGLAVDLGGLRERTLLARLLLAAGQVVSAAFHRRGLDLAEAVGERRCVAESLEGIAAADAAEGNAERAAVLFGPSRALRTLIGSPIPGPDLARFNGAVAATETALGRERFSAAHASGATMPVEQATALAREPDRANAGQQADTSTEER